MYNSTQINNSELMKLYNQNFKNKADEIEKIRVKIVFKYNILKILTIFSLCMFILFMFLGNINIKNEFVTPDFLNNPAGLIIISILSISAMLFLTPIPYIFFTIIFAIWMQIEKFCYVSNIKKDLYPHLFSVIDKNLKYIPGKIKIVPDALLGASICGINLGMLQGIVNTLLATRKYQNLDPTILKGVDIFPEYNEFSIDDVITGSYNGRPTHIVEYELFKNEKRDNKESYSRIQRGILFQTIMDKPFKSVVIVKHKNIKLKSITSLQKVELESNDFANIYDVYGADQVEARYLLTTSLIERLLNIYKEGQNICLYVTNNHVTVIKQTQKDMFEPDISKPANDINNYKNTLLQTQEILDLITQLKLDVNVGL